MYLIELIELLGLLTGLGLLELWHLVYPRLLTGFGMLVWHDSYNYYDIDVDKILFKKSNNEYIIRYNDVNKMTIVPLQLKIKNFFGELHTYTNNNNNRIMSIQSDDKELFRKCREIWNKITELIGINNGTDFVETTWDDDDEFITADVHENTSFVGDSNINKLVIVLHSVIDDYLQTSLVQHINTHKYTYQ